MPMTRDEYNLKAGELMTELSNEAPDKGKISEMLADLRESFNFEVTAREAAEQKQSELTQMNESLQAANMSLFLKCGEVIKQSEENKSPQQSEDKTIGDFSFAFDENGELKK